MGGRATARPGAKSITPDFADKDQIQGVGAAARTPLQAALAPGGASFAILSPFRGEGKVLSP